MMMLGSRISTFSSTAESALPYCACVSLVIALTADCTRFLDCWHYPLWKPIVRFCAHLSQAFSQQTPTA